MTPAANPHFEEFLARALPALVHYREDIVIIGGCARDWYRFTPHYEMTGLKTIDTNDLDVAMWEPMPVRDQTTLHERLVAAGLEARENQTYRGEPADVRYYLASAPKPAGARDPYIECVVPLLGKERDAPGRPQGNQLTASPVRFLDLQLASAVCIDHPRYGPLRVPHPLAYILVKTRMRKHRHQGLPRGVSAVELMGRFKGKTARDQADAFAVVLGFRAAWDGWRTEWQEWAHRSPTWASWMREVLRQWGDLYDTPQSLGCGEVATILELPPDMVSKTMNDFRGRLRLPSSAP